MKMKPNKGYIMDLVQKINGPKINLQLKQGYRKPQLAGGLMEKEELDLS
jgi:hypothetical protein